MLVLPVLQKILSAAVPVIGVILKFDDITPYLVKVPWLPVYFHIQFKILLLVCKALQSKALMTVY